MSALERTLLILVDGRQNLAGLFAALGRQYPADDECLASLQRLVTIGLVTAKGEAGPGCATTRRSLALARLHLIKSVERALRGDTHHLKPVFLGVTDEVSMLRAIDVCHTALVRAGADTQAEAMRARCLELMPEPSNERSGVPVTPTAPPGAADR
ncbi:MAG: hypothetical protein KBF58_04840 [Methyloversatilis sp.]|nr:hypothetical protein [Methyloversatilis sp.]MBP9117391.1 hypothetical protein [Methyloversatilis sp.]